MPLLAHIFEQKNALFNLENFTSRYGADFYGLPLNSGKLTLTKTKAAVKFQKYLPTPQGNVTIFDPGVNIYWQVLEEQ